MRYGSVMEKKIMGLNDVFNFGKWDGYDVEYVLENDKEYLRWCIENKVASFDEDVEGQI